MKYINNFGDIKAMSKYIHFQNGKKDIFNLKISSNAPPSDEQKKNFFNFNTNPQMLGNNINNKNSSRLTNNSTENQEMENEINYNNSRVSNNNKQKQMNFVPYMKITNYEIFYFGMEKNIDHYIIKILHPF